MTRPRGIIMVGQFFGSHLFRVLMFSVIFATAGCDSAKDGELPPAHMSPETVLEENAYRIGPLDQLQIYVWRNPELSIEVNVRPDGHISMPLIDDLRASGKTTIELAHDIEGKLSETIKNPVVNVVAVTFNGTYGQQVRVLGEAVNPSALQYQSNMTLMDVMIQVGGLTEFAAGNRARLVRFVDGRKREYRIRLADLVNDGDIDANIRVLPGDVIVIPGTVF